jgi:tRNA modification GTPase
MSANLPEDLLTVDLLDVYKNLGLIIGAEIEDDLADKIFKDFCMGK